MDLNEEFNRDNVYVPDSDRTQYNLGRRDVVIYIEQILRNGEENE